MPTSAQPFSRSLRSLRADRSRAALWVLAAAALMLGAWGAWMTLSRVALVETSAAARTVAERAVHPVASATAGHVAAVPAVLGAEVAEGAVLVRLDAREAELALAEGRARHAQVAGELAQVAAQIAASDAALARASEASGEAVREGAAERRELELVVSLAREELSRLERLEGLGGVSASELARARTEAARAAAALETRALGGDRGALERERALRDRESDLAALRREEARLDGELALGRLAIERLVAEIERRIVRAPAAGKVAELAPLSRGTWVDAGTTLATVVAGAELAVEAEFPVAASVGRIRPGQRGRLRLDAFPWARYGSVPVTVARVGAEAREGRVQVELSVDPDAAPGIPLAHGLVGSVEVEVDRVAPYELLLRSAGRRSSEVRNRPR
jgi:membrane fusion protein (multidrug efflux system)